jgi:nicotinamidase-related amidase
MAEEFPIIPEKTAMLFFDTLNGGLHPQDAERAAVVKESGYLDILEALAESCRKAGIPVFYTIPEHRQDGKDWGLTVVDSPPRLTTYAGTNYKGSYHATIIPEIGAQDEDYVITKHRWSAFHQTHLELSLRTAGIDTIILAGGSTNVGIASTAYAARDRDFSLIIVRDACRSARDPSINEFFMDEIFPRISRVMTLQELLAKLPVAVAS